MTTLSQLTTSLTTLGLPTPSPTFLTPILSSNSPRPPPLQALVATAKHRLLSADLTSVPSILHHSTPFFPPNITSPTTPSTSLPKPIFVQVLDIQDLSQSKLSQLDLLTSERKGELTKGREIIRIVPQDEGSDPSSASTQILNPAQPALSNNNTLATQSKGPFKLLMQDWKGNQMYGFELKKVEKIGYPPVMGIGCKVLLKRGCGVARGMCLLEPGTMVVFGGRIEGLDKVWKEGWEERLKAEVDRERVVEE